MAEKYLIIKIPFAEIQDAQAVILEVQPAVLIENTIPAEDRLGIAESLGQSDFFQQQIVWQIVDAVEKDTP